MSSYQEIFSYIALLFTPKPVDLQLNESKNIPLITFDDSLVEADDSPNSRHKNVRRSLTQNNSRRGSYTVYHVSLEILLDHTIEGSSVLDDSDYIHSTLGLYILQLIVSRSCPEIKHKALQDQLMLTKYNKKNCFILMESSEWHYWLLDLLYQTFENVEAADAIIDVGIRLHNTVFLFAMEGNDASRHLKRLII